MARNNAFERAIEERKMLSFFKIFKTADLSSERMRALPYDFMSKVSKINDFSCKMVIRAKWGKTWDWEVSKNATFYYIERRGWDQFVSDNALGENELITFTHRGKMIFQLNIYEQNGVEILIPPNPQMGCSSVKTGGIKKEEGDSSYKDVKKEPEETDESPGRFDFQVRKKKTEESRSYKKKVKSTIVETGQSSRGAELKGRKKKAEGSNTSKKKKKNKSDKVVTDDVPEFKINIRKSYLNILPIPKDFLDDHIPVKCKSFTVRHPDWIKSWKVLCLVRGNHTVFSRGYTKMAREYPLSVGDKCTFKLIKRFEFLLVISKKTREETTHCKCKMCIRDKVISNNVQDRD